MAVRLSALRAGLPLPSRKIPGTHFCQRLSRPPGRLEGLGQIEKSNYRIENLTEWFGREEMIFVYKICVII
jgi:hypothetical protein